MNENCTELCLSDNMLQNGSTSNTDIFIINSGGSRIWWKGGVNCHKQGLSPCSRHEVARGGVGQGGGVPPPHMEENGNQEMLRGLLKHTKIRIL